MLPTGAPEEDGCAQRGHASLCAVFAKRRGAGCDVVRTLTNDASLKKVPRECSKVRANNAAMDDVSAKTDACRNLLSKADPNTW
jgi:hypothetical protein